MSRSRKKHPFIGYTTSESEKSDKVSAHKKYRRKVNSLISTTIDFDAFLTPEERELSNIWCFSKDGKQPLFELKNTSPKHYEKYMRK